MLASSLLKWQSARVDTNSLPVPVHPPIVARLTLNLKGWHIQYTVGAKSLAHAINMARLHFADNIIHTKQNFEKPF